MDVFARAGRVDREARRRKDRAALEVAAIVKISCGGRASVGRMFRGGEIGENRKVSVFGGGHLEYQTMK